jgi:transmembrane sensor
MSKEEKIISLIIKLFSGDISPKENDEINLWILESRDNKQIYQELENLWHVTHPVFSPNSIDVKAAELKFMEQVRERKLIHSTLFVWWQRVAAILIVPVIMLAGYLMYNQSFRSNPSEIAYQEIKSPFGVTTKVDLPDGTTVWLNSGSKLKYPVAFVSNERNVYLSGEAFFKVHSDKVHPFIVSTDKMDVKATGTQFNVEAYLTDSITAVTLVEGKVDVNIGKAVVETLSPNQRIVLNSNSNTYSKFETDAQHWGVWKDGILAFRDQPLEDVFKRLGRTFNIDIKVKDTVVARQLYRATFEDESLDEILRLLKISAPIKYKRIERAKQSNNVYNKEQIEVYHSN